MPGHHELQGARVMDHRLETGDEVAPTTSLDDAGSS